MRQLFDKLRAEIIGFLNQREDLILVMPSRDDEAAIPLALLRDVEQAQARDIFLIFSDDFFQPGPFISVMMERLREQHTIVGEALAERGRPALPPIPETVFDTRVAPEVRLKTAIKFTRPFVVENGGDLLVWVIYPQNIADFASYSGLLQQLAPWQGLETWMPGVRIICRDLPASSGTDSRWSNAPCVRIRNVSLGPEAIHDQLASDAADPGQPVEARMQGLLSVALLDQAHNRSEQALAKLNTLLAHYRQSGDFRMQAFVLNACGDIYHRNNNLDGALHFYECAVTPAAAGKDPLILSMITYNLAEVAYKQGRYSDAEQYYSGVDQLSQVTLDVGSKIRALDGKGLSQERQGNYHEAVLSLEASAGLSRQMNLEEPLRRTLGHLQRVYGQLGRYELNPPSKWKAAAFRT